MTPWTPERRPLLNWPDTLVDDAAFRREQAQLARVRLRHRMVAHYARKVMHQDVTVCERLQGNAREIDAAPVTGRLEERIGWFEEAYRQAMGEGASRVDRAAERTPTAAE